MSKPEELDPTECKSNVRKFSGTEKAELAIILAKVLSLISVD